MGDPTLISDLGRLYQVCLEVGEQHEDLNSYSVFSLYRYVLEKPVMKLFFVAGAAPTGVTPSGDHADRHPGATGVTVDNSGSTRVPVIGLMGLRGLVMAVAVILKRPGLERGRESRTTVKHRGTS